MVWKNRHLRCICGKELMEDKRMKQQYRSPVAEYSIVSTTDILTDSLTNHGASAGECDGEYWDNF